MPAGRPPGSRNKRSSMVAAMIKERFGDEYDPLVELLNTAQEAREAGDLASAITGFGKAASFIHPALKAQDINIDGGLRVVSVEMTGFKEPLSDDADPVEEVPDDSDSAD